MTDTMQPRLTCPECRNNDGNKIAGHEVRGVYDGVLYWQCLECGLAWPREFSESYHRLRQTSQEYVDRYNAS